MRLKYALPAILAMALTGCAPKPVPTIATASAYKGAVEKSNDVLDRLKSVSPAERTKYVAAHPSDFALIQSGAFPAQFETYSKLVNERP